VNAVQIIIYAYGMDSRTVRVRYIPYAYSYTVRVYAYGMYRTRTVRYTHAVQNSSIVDALDSNLLESSSCFSTLTVESSTLTDESPTLTVDFSLLLTAMTVEMFGSNLVLFGLSISFGNPGLHFSPVVEFVLLFVVPLRGG